MPPWLQDLRCVIVYFHAKLLGWLRVSGLASRQCMFGASSLLLGLGLGYSMHEHRSHAYLVGRYGETYMRRVANRVSWSGGKPDADVTNVLDHLEPNASARACRSVGVLTSPAAQAFPSVKTRAGNFAALVGSCVCLLVFDHKASRPAWHEQRTKASLTIMDRAKSENFTWNAVRG